jgi:transposase
MPKLKPAAFKILMCFCRKTFGWHKTSDAISKNQIIKCTGMSKNTIQVAIEELEKEGLLSTRKLQDEYGNKPNTYLLNVIKPEDKIYSDPGQLLEGGRSIIDPGVGQILTQGVGQLLTPQKKDITKETYKEEKEYKKKSDAKASGVSVSSSSFLQFGSDKLVKLSQEEFEKLKDSIPSLKELIEELNDYLGSTGKKYKSHYSTLKSWHRRKQDEKLKAPQAQSYMGQKIDRRTKNIDGTPVESPADGLF